MKQDTDTTEMENIKIPVKAKNIFVLQAGKEFIIKIEETDADGYKIIKERVFKNAEETRDEVFRILKHIEADRPKPGASMVP